MGMYEDAMAAAVSRKNATTKRTRDNLAAVIDWIDTAESLASPVGGYGSGGGHSRPNPNNFTGPPSGVSTRALMEGYGGGRSTGAPGPMMSYNVMGMPLTTAKGTKKIFKPFLRALASEGYDINSLGGYANRNIAGTNTPSEHMYGKAIDINPSQNPVSYGSGVNTNLPKNIAALARKYGLVWGGSWHGSKKDPMHFSITGY